MTAGALPDVRDRLMLAFEGTALPPSFEARLRTAPAAGLTLFRYWNVEHPAQVRELVDAAQRAAAGRPGSEGPLLVAADQEGGQLQALGDGTTPFPGAMALGATGDPGLAERVAHAVGTELAALGVNVAYAPVCDLATAPANPNLGIRSFGDDPATTGAMVAATVRGLRTAGVAATAKHFPGLGEAGVDSHHALPVLDHAPERLRRLELAPFRAAIEAGVDLVMSAHVAVPALTGDPTLPATLARDAMHGLLREELGFGGLAITDALDMAALPQDAGMAIDAVAAIRAGIDLLLCTPDAASQARIEAAVTHAAARRLFDPGELRASAGRLAALRRRVAATPRPALEVVGCREHRDLAREVAERSITLVRDDPGLLPLRLGAGDRLLAVMPQPRELTPADTSASVGAGLAAALRRRWATVDELVTSHPPTADEIAAVVERAVSAAVVVVGTISASLDRAQVDLVDALLDTGRPVVTVALRTPWDLAAYPRAAAHVATYGLLEPTLDALAAVLAGDIPCRGRLPVGGIPLAEA